MASTAVPVQFAGTAGVYGQYGWVTGDSLIEPRPELRFTLNPTLSIYGLPLSFSALVSNRESKLRQMLDQFRFAVRPEALLRQAVGTPSPLGFLSFVKGLELGTCHPSWTPLTLSGAPVLGGAVELNPWYVYAAAAAGRNQRGVPVSDSTQGAYARMLYSGRFGFGKKEGTHFYLTALHATDDTTPPANNWQPNPNDTEPPIDSFEVVRPQENYVLGAEFSLDLYKGAFRVESEVAGCEVTRDNRLPVESWDWLPEWAARTFKPRMSSSVDYAFKVRPVLNVFETKLHGEVEMVGPGFQSFGAPGLRKDNLTIGGGVERSFMDNAVTLSASCNTERDNLLAANVTDSAGNVLRVLTLKSRTSRFTSWQASVGIAFPNLPYLQVGYYPNTQATDELDSLARAVSTSTTASNVVSVSAGHSFQTGRLYHSPSVSVSYTDMRGEDPSMDYTNWDLGLDHSIGFEFPLSLSAGAGYSRSVSVSAGPPDTRLYFNLTPSYTAFGTWNNSLTLGGTFGTATRLDTRYSSSFPVWKICDARLGVADAIYNGDDGTYNDLRLTAELNKSW